jgi:hypothetical protein
MRRGVVPVESPCIVRVARDTFTDPLGTCSPLESIAAIHNLDEGTVPFNSSVAHEGKLTESICAIEGFPIDSVILYPESPAGAWSRTRVTGTELPVILMIASGHETTDP